MSTKQTVETRKTFLEKNKEHPSVKSNRGMPFLEVAFMYILVII